jgi:acetyl-CoA acetyltransferase
VNEVFLGDAVRTPFGRYGGALSSIRADDLAAIPIRALIARNPDVDWSAVDDVILGCANQAGEDNRNVWTNGSVAGRITRGSAGNDD